MYNGLKEYVKFLEEKGELRRIREFVDPVVEIACATDIESKKPGGGKALLFENTGTAYPVLTNLMGSEARIRYALGVPSLDEIGPRIDALIDSVLSEKRGLRDKFRMIPLLNQAASWMPRQHKGHAPCQDSVQYTAKLSAIPILKCWPQDGGRFITLPLVNTVSPVTGVRNGPDAGVGRCHYRHALAHAQDGRETSVRMYAPPARGRLSRRRSGL